MTDTRDSISKLIADLRKSDALWESMRPQRFENVIAELIAQNNSIAAMHRASEAADLVLKMQNQYGHLQSIAVEVKNYQKLLGLEEVDRFRNRIENSGYDRNLLVTSSYFTEEARRVAQQYDYLRLIDRSDLRSWIEQYNAGRHQFLSSLFDRAEALEIELQAEIDEPDPEQIEALSHDSQIITPEQHTALITVDSLPLRLLTKIMRSPEELRNITPRQFEEFVAETISQLGFKDVLLTPRSHDGGKDVVASYRINGIPLSFYFECKHYAEGNKVQLETLRTLLGTMAHDARSVNKGVLVTTSTFTKGARKFILGEARLDGKDYTDLLGWINELKGQLGDG